MVKFTELQNPCIVEVDGSIEASRRNFFPTFVRNTKTVVEAFGMSAVCRRGYKKQSKDTTFQQELTQSIQTQEIQKSTSD
jgi:hypothetical protein